jgi:hypothetical protein
MERQIDNSKKGKESQRENQWENLTLMCQTKSSQGKLKRLGSN